MNNILTQKGSYHLLKLDYLDYSICPQAQDKKNLKHPGFPYPAALYLGAPSPKNLCQHVSHQIIHFQVLNKNLFLGP